LVSFLKKIFHYISENQSSPLSIKDKTHNKIVDRLNEFIQNLPKKDKQLLLQTISKCYLEYQDSIIKDNGNSL